MIVVDVTDERALAPLYTGGWDAPREVRDRVTAMLDDVRARGDDALVEYTQRFDHAAASVASIRVEIPSRKHARGLVPEVIAAGLELARECVNAFLGAQFTHEVRHMRRLGKIDKLEQKFGDA